MKNKIEKLVVIGAGPAGIGCSQELLLNKNKDIELNIFDKNNQIGGLSRTYKYKGFYFDVGPHRFFTKNKEINNLWKKTLSNKFIKVLRLTRILYKNKLFLYPIKLLDVLSKLGIKESVKSLLSYIYARIFYKKNKSFEDWITSNFGKKLFIIFFKTYTEKVWGISCKRIAAAWATQRIKNLNFIEVIKTAFFYNNKSKAKSLVDSFYYPLNGTGSMYEAMGNKIKKLGGIINLDSKIIKIFHKNNRITALVYEFKCIKKRINLDYLFSSMPLTYFVNCLNPLPEAIILKANNKLYYRDHITVNLIIKKDKVFLDNWIYVHSPEVKMARIANYNNFSKKMSKKGMTAISVEYFVFKNDNLWKMKDQDLISLAIKEMDKVKLISINDVVDGFVVRETESYPTYYLGYKKYYDIIKTYVSKFKNLQLIGRGGMYKYNNMDHSLYSGILAARNYNNNRNIYNIWNINEDAEYLEEKK